MSDINLIVESTIRKQTGISIDELTKNISESIENRLFLEINENMTYSTAKKIFRRKYFEELFIFTFGNISKAAKISGLNRRQIHRIIKTLNIKAQTYRSAMQRPYDYIREDIKNIVEKRLDHSKSYVKEDKLSKLYMRAPKIAELVTKKIGVSPKSFNKSFKEFEREYFSKLLKKTGQDLDKSSKVAKISKRTLQRKIKQVLAS